MKTKFLLAVRFVVLTGNCVRANTNGVARLRDDTSDELSFPMLPS